MSFLQSALAHQSRLFLCLAIFGSSILSVHAAPRKAEQKRSSSQTSSRTQKKVKATKVQAGHRAAKSTKARPPRAKSADRPLTVRSAGKPSAIKTKKLTAAAAPKQAKSSAKSKTKEVSPGSHSKPTTPVTAPASPATSPRASDAETTSSSRETEVRDTGVTTKEARPTSGNEVQPVRSKRKLSKLDVIVIDAGHGGRDPGAIGPNGVREKDATLGIALKLGKLIEAELAGVKVVYTRKTDSFVELYRRGQIANEKKAKLFISIHCNSTPQKPSKASGFETYILRPGKTDAAIKVASRENAVIEYEKEQDRYAPLSETEFILTSMARSQDVRFSEKFAALVQQEFDKELDIRNNGVAQAGFLVLVGASMPNVLIETAYISNPDEEALLGSDSGQAKFARGILEAIRKYKDHYEGS